MISHLTKKKYFCNCFCFIICCYVSIFLNTWFQTLKNFCFSLINVTINWVNWIFFQFELSDGKKQAIWGCHIKAYVVLFFPFFTTHFIENKGFRTCLSQYVTSLGFFHYYQTCIDVVIFCVLQLHTAVINCRQQKREDQLRMDCKLTVFWLHSC